jgi:phage shock protein A
VEGQTQLATWRPFAVDTESIEKTLELVLSEIGRVADSVERYTVDQIIAANRLRKVLDDIAGEMIEWEQRASSETERGNEALADEARKLSRTAADVGRPYRERLEQLEVTIQQSKQALQRLNDRVVEAKRAREEVTVGDDLAYALRWVEELTRFLGRMAADDDAGPRRPSFEE